jgi:small conductance mechanosensitive channel
MSEWLDTLAAVPLALVILQLALLALFFILVRMIARMVRSRVQHGLETAVLDADRRHRLETLHRVGYGATITALAVLTLFMALQIVGLPIGPLLGSAGVVGLAISLGAQTLIRDYLGGILILAEDQFRVGDVVEVGGVAGEVVRMTMRVTYLRDLHGKLHTVPNGDIRVISNLTRDWSRAVVDFNLELGADMDRVQGVLQSAVARAQVDPAIKDLIIGDPDIVTWNNVTDWAIQVRLLARTLPGKQWGVARELRRHGLAELKAAGVRLARPTTLLAEERPSS